MFDVGNTAAADRDTVCKEVFKFRHISDTDIIDREVFNLIDLSNQGANLQNSIHANKDEKENYSIKLK